MKRAFTLIEFLIYMVVFSLLAAAAGSFYYSAISSSAKGQAIIDLEEQGIFIINTLGRQVRRASAINSPTVGASATALSLAMALPAEDPVIFATSSAGAITMSVAGVSSNLTDPDVYIASLRFTNYSVAGAPGIISYSITLRYKNPGNRQEFNYGRTFQGSINLRK